jgi:hypothetical protein
VRRAVAPADARQELVREVHVDLHAIDRQWESYYKLGLAGTGRAAGRRPVDRSSYI